MCVLYPAKIVSVEFIFGEKRYYFISSRRIFGHDVILRHVVTGRKRGIIALRTESELPAKVKPRSEVSEAL